eukprot:CFRG2166T1
MSHTEDIGVAITNLTNQVVDTVNATLNSLNDTMMVGNQTYNITNFSAEQIRRLKVKQEVLAFRQEHKGHDAMHAEMFFIIMAVTIGAQLLLMVWKKHSEPTYKRYTLLAMWIVPFWFSWKNNLEQMLTMWSIFSVITGWVTFKATRKPLHSRTPKLVYNYFLLMYKICYAVGLIGYILFMLIVFGGGAALARDIKTRRWVVECVTTMLFYGLYYGCLLRDFAEICAESMGNSIGYYSDTGIPKKYLSDSVCAVCGDDFTTGDEQLMLECNHKVHHNCIRGWAIVGKKSTCPYCKEKVDLRKIAPSPWLSQDVAFGTLLDGLRYLVAWQPLIVLTAQSLISVFNLH